MFVYLPSSFIFYFFHHFARLVTITWIILKIHSHFLGQRVLSDIKPVFITENIQLSTLVQMFTDSLRLLRSEQLFFFFFFTQFVWFFSY